jgi:F0F1-type ATP synthase membrane subunit c/vacuolar-type H+-ATPase subunit K
LKASTTATPNIITTTTAVQTTTVPQVAMPTESPAHHDTTAEYNDDDSTTTDQEDEDTATATEQYNYTTTAEEETFTTATPEIIFEPTSSNNDPVFAAPTNNDPNDLYTNIDAAAGNDISNKALGIGLGVGIGCIAALGLAGLLIHNRKRQQQAPLNEEAAATAVPTRWRPQSFMGVVASVVSKLPRSPSQRSKASTDMLAGAAVPGTGVAIGHGEGAVEEQQRRQY